MGRGIDMSINGKNKAGNNILGFPEDKVVFVGTSKNLEWSWCFSCYSDITYIKVLNQNVKILRKTKIENSSAQVNLFCKSV